MTCGLFGIGEVLLVVGSFEVSVSQAFHGVIACKM